MECLVVKAFFDKYSGDGYNAGDVYMANDKRISELQALGYVQVIGAAKDVSKSDTKNAGKRKDPASNGIAK